MYLVDIFVFAKGAIFIYYSASLLDLEMTILLILV